MATALWFRRDLRTEDNLLLAQNADAVHPLFIFDPEILDSLPPDDRRVSFIFRQVLDLKSKLQAMGLDLALYYGKPAKVFAHLKQQGIVRVFASVDYDSHARKRDAKVAEQIEFHAIQDCYFFSPDELLKSDGTPYRVFTPFYKCFKERFTPGHMERFTTAPLRLVGKIEQGMVVVNDIVAVRPLDLATLGFEERSVDSSAPEKKLADFRNRISSYAENRDFLDRSAVSDLGIDLRFGTVSIREIARTLVQWKKQDVATEPFFRQLVWREFFAYLLYHFPHSEVENFQPMTPRWDDDEDVFNRWKNGETGVPIIDAAMRQLQKEGQMHNRARMITASFLTKDLHIDWRWGERHFARYLLDYDAASNVGSWQWAASTGADAQPYFRVFNPYLQSKKFDSKGTYIRRYVPELADVPSKILHDEGKLSASEIAGYPKPIVEHKIESKEAIARFKSAKGAG